MVEANFIICMGELSSIVMNQGIKTCMEHRKNVIEDGRKDDLISVSII